MARKEGSFAHGEKPSRPAEHRADGNEHVVDLDLKILITQFGPDVVDDPILANKLRQEALSQRLAATANRDITLEELRELRVAYQEEYKDYVPEQTASFSPIANVVDMPEIQPPTPPQTQSMYDLSGGPQ